MFFGYEQERSRLDGIVAAALAGDGGAIVVTGAAGAGKSSLLATVAGGVADRSQHLKVQGAEPEATIPFAALHQLLAPLIDDVRRLPPPQAESLRAALALEAVAPGDPLALGAAVHSLLTSADEPVVLTVDDSQSLDRSSLGVLAFVARRLHGTPVAMLVAERTGHGAPVDQLAGLARVELTGLDQAAARSMMAMEAPDASREVVDALHEETGGNPLALHEAAVSLPPEVLRGATQLPGPVPVGLTLQDHYGAQIAALPERSRRALVLVAAGGGSVQVVPGALRSAGSGWSDLEAAEAAGLLQLDAGEVRFSHPLVRAAAYHLATPSERRRAHRLLADADPDPDRQAWHLCRAARGTDEPAAAGLQRSAGRALARGAYSEAAAALEAAARLTADASMRLGCRMEAARAWHLAGIPEHALASLDAATTDTGSELDRARLEEVRGGIELWLGQPRVARDRFRADATRVARLDPVLAARLRVLATLTSTMIADLDDAERLAETAWDELSGGPLAGWAASALGIVKLLVGDYRAGTALTQRAVDALELIELQAAEVDPRDLSATFFTVQSLRLAERFSDAEALAQRLIDHARRGRAPGLLPLPLALLADVHLAVGSLHDARAEITEALEVCDLVGHVTERCHVIAVMARVEAALGDPSAERRAREVLSLVDQTGARSMEAYARHALGVLALGQGRLDDAAVELEGVGELLHASGVRHPSVIPWTADLVEALVRSGRADEAAALVDDLRAQAERLGTTYSRAVAERCTGLLGGEEAERILRDAVARQRAQDTPMEAARTELALGEVLRRKQRRRDARRHLSRAAATFHRIGAAAWVDRASAELRAAGGRVPTPTDDRLQALNPQELRITLRVAGGETNREVAAACYVSPKTVEATLTSVYAKLGVRSRTELARLVTLRDGGQAVHGPGTRGPTR